MLKAKFPITEGTDDLLEAGNIDISYRWINGKWDIDKLIEEADIIDGIRFVKLEEVLKWKRARNAEKDKADIELIERFLEKE
jgi:hypothetical protein